MRAASAVSATLRDAPAAFLRASATFGSSGSGTGGLLLSKTEGSGGGGSAGRAMGVAGLRTGGSSQSVSSVCGPSVRGLIAIISRTFNIRGGAVDFFSSVDFFVGMTARRNLARPPSNSCMAGGFAATTFDVLSAGAASPPDSGGNGGGAGGVGIPPSVGIEPSAPGAGGIGKSGYGSSGTKSSGASASGMRQL